MTKLWSKERMASLTIGIPTFNRRDAVFENVSALVSDESIARLGISILVIDNGSEDGTFEALGNLKSEYSARHLTVSKNNTNLGVFLNVFRIFDECKTDYLMLTSDEDFVITENLSYIVDFLSNRQPKFVAPQFILNGEIYRGATRTRNIKVNEWESAGFYISGLIYRVEDVRLILATKKLELLKPYIYYPWNLLVAEFLYLSPKTVWFVDYPIAKKKFDLETDISSDSSVGKYWHLNSRWEQLKAVDGYFANLLNQVNDKQSLERIAEMRRLNRMGFYKTMMHSIQCERQDLVQEIRLGAELALNGRAYIICRIARYFDRTFRVFSMLFFEHGLFKAKVKFNFKKYLMRVRKP